MPFPFSSAWESLGSGGFDDLLRVQLRCYKRTPKPHALICALTAEDLALFKERSSVPIEEPLGSLTKPNKATSKADLLENLGSVEITRQLIGFVTSGGYSFVFNKGFATGFVSRQYEAALQGGLVLFRNTESRFYHVCKVSLGGLT